MYTLYGDPGSGSCIIELALSELEVGYKAVDIDLGANAQREPGYATINPQQKIPCLVYDDGPPLTESVAILLTLIDNHADASLLPTTGTVARSTALRWLLYVATEIYPVVEINDYPERFCGEGNQPDATRANAKALWRKRWQIVEDNIQGAPYLLTSGFCVTDLYIAVVSRWAQQSEWRPENIPRVERIATAVAARKNCREVWKRHFG